MGDEKKKPTMTFVIQGRSRSTIYYKAARHQNQHLLLYSYCYSMITWMLTVVSSQQSKSGVLCASKHNDAFPERKQLVGSVAIASFSGKVFSLKKACNKPVRYKSEKVKIEMPDPGVI